MAQTKYKRVMLKLSGEVVGGDGSRNIDFALLENLCKEVVEVADLGVELVIVIGGGNFWRARDFKDTGIDRVESDNIGMLATVINAVAIRSMIKKLGRECVVMSAVPVSDELAEPFNSAAAQSALSEKKIVICAGGTGSPFFTTDSTAALRALETKCDVLLKATNVDGVYSADPDTNPSAERFDELSYNKVLEMELGFMDAAAVSLARDNELAILVFNLEKTGNIKRAVLGEKTGTLVQ